MVQRRGRGVVRGQVYDDPLALLGKRQRLVRQPQGSGLRVLDVLGPDASRGHREVCEPVGERRPRRHRQLVGQLGHVRVAQRGLVPELGDQVVGHAVPVGVGGAGPLVGEQVPEQVGPAVVEQPERSGEPRVAVRVGEDVADPVEHHGGGGLQAVQYGPHGGARAAAEGRGRGAEQRVAAVGLLGQPAQQHAVAQRQVQRVGEGTEHLDGRVAVAALFQPGEVLDADSGQGGQFGAAKAGGAAAGAGGETHLDGGDGFAPGPQERAQLVVAHIWNVPMRAGERMALRLPRSGRSPCEGTVAPGLRHDE